MEVKGTAVKTTRDFVKELFPTQFDTWVNSLPEKSKKIFADIIDSAAWYPMNEGYIIPINKMADMFYKGNAKTVGDALGIYSADIALKGIYKAFLLIASPNFLMSRASKIITTYYVPSDVNIIGSGEKTVTLQITRFPEISNAIEYRIAAWCKRALELSNCKNVEYRITKFLSKMGPCTEIIYTWG